MNTTINTVAQRLEYNNMTIQQFPMTHTYKIPCFHIYININTRVSKTDKCLIYRNYIIEPFEAMMDDYYEDVNAHWYITNNTIQMTLNKPMEINGYITLMEMFIDLINTIEDVSITYEKTILNINETNTID